ncbi:DUF4282 domain-containing protein [Citrobacter portucalensis]|uniref:DUF4282 domain-containing protein n=1 Tax=Citrobacter portucalensis TaxID=1639133 RepID=UPI00242D1BBB|nr:DUF4282 domain-containing protein [Citrobacter portucalensis]WFZ22223.1 DUF4282 domain-containing protein [Citrobacter portucalensis]
MSDKSKDLLSVSYKGWVTDVIKAIGLSMSAGEKNKRSNKLFKLENMITPKILTGIYILTTLLAALMCVITFLGGSAGGAFAWALIAVFNRIFFECIIVVFKNNEYLKSSSESLHQIARLLAENKIKTVQNTAPDADFNVNNKETAADKSQPVNSQDKQ